MPRDITTTFRNQLEASEPTNVLLVFATITHAYLTDPIRAVNDVVDYVYGGNTFIGVPFEITLMSDSERPPKARIRMHNVDQKIGNAVLQLPDSPRIKLEILSDSDFSAAVAGVRTEITTGAAVGEALGLALVLTHAVAGPTAATVEYSADYLRLANVSGDAVAVEADLVSFDLSAEPWPQVRTTPDRTPALFR